MTKTHAITGVSGYTGRYIAERIARAGHDIVSLTGHPHRPTPLNGRITVKRYDFDDLQRMAEDLNGVDTLFNTYWIRMAYGDMNHERASANLKTLFGAAREAGVRRIVHVSIANADIESPLPYYRGKGVAEEFLRQIAPSYAIVKPTLLFGHGDILLNNISWALRRFPVFPVPGRGDYPVQPGFVEDIADLAVELGKSDTNVEVDAVGPETYSYMDYVRLVRDALGSKCAILKTPASLTLLGTKLVGAVVGDVVLTRDEIRGLSSGLLTSRDGGEPTLSTRFSEWIAQNARGLGARYASELKRHYR